MNSTYVSCGAGLTKFTGARGKSGSNDASAEFMAEVRKMFNDEGRCVILSEQPIDESALRSTINATGYEVKDVTSLIYIIRWNIRP